MTSYSNECREFQRLFRRFIGTARPFLMHRVNYSDRQSEIDQQLGGLLIRNEKVQPRKRDDRAYRNFKQLLHFIKGSNYIIEYIPYSDITHIIYQDSSMDTHQDIQRLIVHFWNKYKKEYEPKNNSKDEESSQLILELEIVWDFEFNEGDFQKLERAIYKIVEHIKLAILQRSNALFERNQSIEFIDKQIAEKVKMADDLKDKIDNFEETINLTKSDIENELSKIYVQFVTILGIFTAIVVSVFGGLSIVSGVFDKINDTPIWKLILVGSMVSIFILCLLFLLTRWISTIIRKTFDYEGERSLLLIVTNNGAFATGIFIFSYLIIASVIFSSHEAKMQLKKMLVIWDALPLFLLLIFPLILGLGLFIKVTDMKKREKGDTYY